MIQRSRKQFFPSPFALVIGLTVLCFLMVIIFGIKEEVSFGKRTLISLGYWQQGFFSLLTFTLQMIMILVFGYALAVFQPVHLFLKRIAHIPKNKTQGVLMTGIIAMVGGLLNWGFGLVIGALLARFVYVAAKEKGYNPNPALLAAAGYLGMAVWHGGLSGSAPLKVAEKGHFLEGKIGVIPISETIGSISNFWVSIGLVFVFALSLLVFSNSEKSAKIEIDAKPLKAILPGKRSYFAFIIGFAMVLIAFFNFVFGSVPELASVNINTINFLLFGLTLIAYQSMGQFKKAIGSGIKSSIDIFIQFPFYAGILGLMTHSGLLEEFSSGLVSNASQSTLPLISYVSAAAVNLIIPSGGGQFAVQGPIILDSAKAMGMSIGKMVLVFSYGDQISNLLQPFWALPLITITGVKAKDLFKYCLGLCLIGGIYLGMVVYFLA
ncbi:TIGR00366 family protein [Algoriphagus machipongonensis]|nr:TIGR00366 family protein [Algoriphagus machipongonensis]